MCPNVVITYAVPPNVTRPEEYPAILIKKTTQSVYQSRLGTFRWENEIDETPFAPEQCKSDWEDRIDTLTTIRLSNSSRSSPNRVS